MSENMSTELIEVTDEQVKAVVSAEGSETAENSYVMHDDYLALSKSIARVEDLLDKENNALVGLGDVDLEESAYLKGKAMLELDLAGKVIGPENLPSEIVVRLQSLQETLATNMKLLSTQLNAVTEVSSLLSRVMKEQDSDGTYESLVGSW